MTRCEDTERSGLKCRGKRAPLELTADLVIEAASAGVGAAVVVERHVISEGRGAETLLRGRGGAKRYCVVSSFIDPNWKTTLRRRI